MSDGKGKSAASKLDPVLLGITLVGSVVVVAAAAGLGGLDPYSGAGLAIVALAKGLALATAGGVGLICARTLKGWSWRLLSLGLTLWFLGQSALIWYQLILHQPMPFPSIADLFFVPGTFLVAAALFAFLIELAQSGLPIDMGALMPKAMTLTAGVTALVAWITIAPLFPVESVDVTLLLGLLYPLCDILLLLPSILLYLATRELKGGGAWRVWGTLLGGVALLLMGDTLFALLLGHDGGNKLVVAAVDIGYLAGYSWVARACLFQLDLLD